MIKNEKGITLVSLIITIVLMTIVASTVAYISLDRFEINKLKKMFNDIELLQDKVANYYLKFEALPVVRDSGNTPIEYNYSELDFEKNSADNEKYYILDVSAMEGISLNYGKEGFETPNTSEDVYIINEQSHIIYYVKGMELKGVMHYTLTNISGIAEDVIPPSTPQIKVISGSKNTEGLYTTEVELELIPGREDGNVAKQTEFSIDNGSTWTNITTLTNNIYKISTTGQHSIIVRSYDKNENISEKSMDLEMEIRVRKILTAYSESSSLLQLTRSYAGMANNYRIYGNSVQNGTPTPDTPVEVESVGDKTKNLCGGDNVLLNKVIGNSANGKIVDSEIYNTVYMEVNEGETYTFTNFVRADGSSLKGCFYDENGAWISAFETTTVTIPTGAKYIGRSFNNSVTEVQLELGDTATSYEPYGYKIPVKATGRNLVNIPDMNIKYTGYYQNYFPKNPKLLLQPSTKYTVSFDYVINSATETVKCGIGYGTSYYTVDMVYGKAYPNQTQGKFEHTFTTPATFSSSYTPYLQFRLVRAEKSGTFDVDISNIQVELGSQATEYEGYKEQTFNIYLDEPLRKVGDYEDYIDFENKQIVRKIAETQFLSSYMQGASGSSTDTTFIALVSPSSPFGGAKTGAISTPRGYNSVGTISQWNISSEDSVAWANNALGNTTSFFRIPVSLLTEDGYENTLEGAKAWVNAQNESNPIIITYILETPPDPETIELPELKTFDEYTNIEVLTEAPPSKIEVTYDGYEFQ